MAGTEALVTLEPCGPAPRRAAHERAARRDPVGTSRPGHATAVDPRPGGRPRDLPRSHRDGVRTAHRGGPARRRVGAPGPRSPGQGSGHRRRERRSRRARPSRSDRRRSRRCTPARPTRRCSPGRRGGARIRTRCATSRTADWATAIRPASRSSGASWPPTSAGFVRPRSMRPRSSSPPGASQALALLATALRQAGETAIGVEDPGSEPIRTHLVTHDLRPVPIPVDGDGLVVDDLAESGVRAVVVTPAHQFPLGHVLAPARRAAARGVGPRDAADS